MSVLGAIIAGGASQRFGSDKAIEQLDGQAMIDHVSAALSRQTDDIVVCGHSWPGLTRLDDRPAADLGPLGGINAALHYAKANGFTGVLCMPVDVHPAPANIVDQLTGEQVSVLKEQHLIGYWPTTFADPLEAYLQEGLRKVQFFLERVNARRVDDPPGLINVNRPQDLERLKSEKSD